MVYINIMVVAAISLAFIIPAIIISDRKKERERRAIIGCAQEIAQCAVLNARIPSDSPLKRDAEFSLKEEFRKFDTFLSRHSDKIFAEEVRRRMRLLIGREANAVVKVSVR